MSKPDSTPGLSLSLRIDWSELDMFGHVNNVSFFKYIQSARVNYWQKMGLYDSYGETGTGPVLVSCTCDFKRPLHYPGEVVIHSRMEFMKNTSFGFYHILKNNKDELVAEARDVIVTFDFRKGTKVKVPGAFRDAASEIEGRIF